MPDALSATFRRPFAQQVAAWRLRLGDLVPTAKWDDLWQDQHDRAFMVAGAVKADLLADLAAAVDRSIAEGQSIETFRRDFRAIVEKHGWHGWTGEGTKRGEAWRTRVIYRTNISTSYAAGRHAQLLEAGFPLWVYKHSGAEHPRLDHLSWNGIVLPADHPFWVQHFPPNGWGCGCTVFGARSEAGARRVGGIPGKDLPPGWDTVDPRTGAQQGIGRGWGYTPGATTADTIRAMTEKAVNWDYSLAVAYMRSLPPETRDAFVRGYRDLPSLADELRRYADRVATSGPEASGLAPQRTMGLLTSTQAETIGTLAEQDIALFDTTVDPSAVLHVLNRHADTAIERSRGQRPVTPADFGHLPRLLNEPDSIVPATLAAGRGPILRYEKQIGTERHVALFELRMRRRRLSLVTFWVERVAAATPPSTS